MPYKRLRHARDARGRRLTIHKIHQPGPLYMTAEEAAGIDVRAGTHPRRAGDRLPASYINFYVTNKSVVMPLYDKRWDAAAMRTLRRLFPTPPGRRRRDARSAARRRQYPLHHPAGPPSRRPAEAPRTSVQGRRWNFAARAVSKAIILRTLDPSPYWKTRVPTLEQNRAQSRERPGVRRRHSCRLPQQQPHQRLWHRVGHLHR